MHPDARPAAGPRRTEAGFTLIEMAASLALAMVMLIALHNTLRSSVSARKDAELQHRIDTMAANLLMRLREINFGKTTDPAPTTAALDELFDDDEDYGSITLMQLRPNVTFTTSGAGMVGTWRVSVSDDLNGDGDTADPREGRPDLVRVVISFNGIQQYATLRSADPAFCRYDAGATY
jgi:hypothetical protein